MMSITTAKQFLQKVQNDQALQSKLQTLSNGKREGTLAEIVRIAAADGFVFTAGEYEAALKEHLAPVAGELSEEDLELVAGGTKRKDLQKEIKEKQAQIAELQTEA